jgi:hypothetical protein
MKEATIPLSLGARTEELDRGLARNGASWRWLDKRWARTEALPFSREGEE